MTVTSQQRLGTYNAIDDANSLGQIGMFQDQDQTDILQPLINSGTPIYAILVKNSKGGTLSPGTGVTFKSGKIGKEVDALSGANTICDGIVDPFVVGTVPDAAFFWLIIQGPTSVKVAAGGVTQNAEVQTAASGLFGDGTAGTNPIGHCGKANATGTSGNLVRIYFRSAFAAVRP